MDPLAKKHHDSLIASVRKCVQTMAPAEVKLGSVADAISRKIERDANPSAPKPKSPR